MDFGPGGACGERLRVEGEVVAGQARHQVVAAHPLVARLAESSCPSSVSQKRGYRVGARLDAVDEDACLACADLHRDAPGVTPDDGGALPQGLGDGQAEPLPQRLLDGHVGVSLKRVDL